MVRISALLSVLATLAEVPHLSHAHSWPEAINTINNQGTIEGSTGYIRNFVPRCEPGFKGDETDSFQKTQVLSDNVPVCMSRQQTQTQSPSFPRLQASPGAKIAIRYAENGHVTIEQPGRPPAGGPIYVFGTTAPKEGQSLAGAWEWNAAGTGGDKTGKLLAQQPFDDGRCYEMNPSQNSSMRQAKSPLNGALPIADYSGLPCQNDFVLPSDAPVGKLYTVYWVWNFTSPDPQMGGTEIYSDCFDIDVVKPSSGAVNDAVVAPAFNSAQPVISAAVPQYFGTIAAAAASPTPPSQLGQSSPNSGQSPASTSAGNGSPAVTVTAYVTAPASSVETVIVTETVLPSTSNVAANTAAVASNSGTAIVYPSATAMAPPSASTPLGLSSSAAELPSTSAAASAVASVVASSAAPVVSAATSVPASVISAAIASASTPTGTSTLIVTVSTPAYPSATASASAVNADGKPTGASSLVASPMASGAPCKPADQVNLSKLFAGTQGENAEAAVEEKHPLKSAKFRYI